MQIREVCSLICLMMRIDMSNSNLEKLSKNTIVHDVAPIKEKTLKIVSFIRILRASFEVNIVQADASVILNKDILTDELLKEVIYSNIKSISNTVLSLLIGLLRLNQEDEIRSLIDEIKSLIMLLRATADEYLYENYKPYITNEDLENYIDEIFKKAMLLDMHFKLS